jgi:hypothetical protein
MNPLFLKTAFYAVLLSLFFRSPVLGQSEKVEAQDSALSKQKDILDVLQEGLAVHLRKDNISIKGKGPFVSVMPVVGYSLQSGLTGAIVSNTSFYTDSTRNKFSNLLVNGYYSEYHQYWFTANDNIFFEKQKIHLFGDTRYYNFPTQTFGYGTKSKLSDELDIKYSYLRICQIIYREIIPNTFVGIGYNLDYHWNLKIDSVPGKALNDLEKYQKTTHSISSGVSLNFLFDNRKNSVNPEGGFYASVQYRPNLTLLGSDSNWQSLLVDLRTYVKLPASSRNILAFWSYNNLTLNGTPPYLDMPSIGWDAYSNTGRGYVPGRYVGLKFNYLESEYRFAITRNGLLGGVVFGNVEKVYKKWTDLHTIIPGEGLGIRIKLNKYSNTNLAIDYGFGVGGSHGLFFNLGEVF